MLFEGESYMIVNRDKFFQAIEKGRLKTVKAMISELGLDVKDDWGNSTLQQACFYNREKFLSFLLETGVALDPMSLIAAANMGYSDIEQLIIDKGVDVNVPDDFGMTALMYTAKKDAVLVKGLL